MKRMWIASLVLLFSAWAGAQQTYPAQNTNQNNRSTKIEGCLGRSDGGFVLTDKAGKRYELSGDTSTLTEHVGHEVQISGTETPSSTPSVSSTTPPANRVESGINVTGLKHISKTCKTGTSTGTGSKPPMSEKPPMSR